jgi:hypothetical protein
MLATDSIERALQAIERRRGRHLFVVALTAFTIALIDFAREVRIALSEFDHYG